MKKEKKCNKKRKPIKTKSAKSKGRMFQQWVCQKIADLTGVECGKDCAIESRPMGQTGVDVRLEKAVYAEFPFSVECKRQENWSVHNWIRQTQKNQLPDTEWILFVRKNRMEPYSIAILDSDVFFRMVELIPKEDRKKIIQIRRITHERENEESD